ncbi:MAG TPA: hypothetical protein V6D12_24620, partial [Candidatus Obscuribacterales bacterium]
STTGETGACAIDSIALCFSDLTAIIPLRLAFALVYWLFLVFMVFITMKKINFSSGDRNRTPSLIFSSS